MPVSSWGGARLCRAGQVNLILTELCNSIGNTAWYYERKAVFEPLSQLTDTGISGRLGTHLGGKKFENLCSSRLSWCCPSTRGQGWSLSVCGDKSMEAVRPLTETQLSVVSLLLLILWKPLYFWGALGKWGAEVISEANAKTGRADTWGINGSRGPEERMRVGKVEQEQPQAAWKRSAGMLVREGWLCLTLMEREKAGDSSVHCSHRLHCSGPCQSWLTAVAPVSPVKTWFSSHHRHVVYRERALLLRALPKQSMRKEITLSPHFSRLLKARGSM